MSDQVEILVVEDEPGHAEVLAEGLEREHYLVTVAGDGLTALDKFRRRDPYVVVTDLKLGGEIDGLEIVRQVRASGRTVESVVITAHGSIDTCKQALREGAYDYIEKPIDLDFLRAVVKRAVEKVQLARENRRLQETLDEKFGFEGVVGQSPAMLRVLETVRRAARSDVPVLITGESGVGKELVAAAIHNNSPRRGAPFQPVNCAGLSDTLLESELFGHVRGAFTGATTDRKGLFAAADGGTLFLDEIGDMPLSMQAKLLRVLENQIVVPVGATQGTQVDVRIISATNQDLTEAVEQKRFRQDLYYRVQGVKIDIPPLRQRREDIGLLLENFLQKFSEAEDKPIKAFTPAALRLLVGYDWPGNVRELRNCVKAMVVLADQEKLDVGDLPFEISQRQEQPQIAGDLAGVNLNELEKQAIRRTLEMVDGNREQAAKMLGIGERTLYRKIKEYEL